MAKKVVEVVEPWHHEFFKIRKTTSTEQEVMLHFGRRVSYKVVKLSTKGLPAKGRDKKAIRWINNWGVQDSKGKYVKKVRYTLFLRPARSKKEVFVYKDARGLHWGKTPTYKGRRPPRSGWRQVEFETGDPAAGWG